MARLEEEIQSSPTALHHLTFILQHQYDDHLMSRVGVGFAQTRIMEVLHESLPRSQRYVADRLGQTEANVSRQLRHLKQRRLVNIIKNKHDARAREITLTSEGAKRLREAQKLLKNQYEDLFDFLSQRDVLIFNRVVGRLLQAIRPPAAKD